MQWVKYSIWHPGIRDGFGVGLRYCGSCVSDGVSNATFNARAANRAVQSNFHNHGPCTPDTLAAPVRAPRGDHPLARAPVLRTPIALPRPIDRPRSRCHQPFRVCLAQLADDLRHPLRAPPRARATPGRLARPPGPARATVSSACAHATHKTVVDQASLPPSLRRRPRRRPLVHNH